MLDYVAVVANADLNPSLTICADTERERLGIVFFLLDQFEAQVRIWVRYGDGCTLPTDHSLCFRTDRQHVCCGSRLTATWRRCKLTAMTAKKLRDAIGGSSSSPAWSAARSITLEGMCPSVLHQRPHILALRSGSLHGLRARSFYTLAPLALWLLRPRVVRSASERRRCVATLLPSFISNFGGTSAMYLEVRPAGLSSSPTHRRNQCVSLLLDASRVHSVCGMN